MDQEKVHLPTIEDIKRTASEVASLMKQGPLTPETRSRFIAVRAAMFMRGIYDPVLVRFDSATAPRASNEEVAAQLETVAQSL